MKFIDHRKRFNPFGVEIGRIVENRDELEAWGKVDLTHAPQSKNARIDLRKIHRKVSEASAVLALLLVFALLQLLRNSELGSKQFETVVQKIEVEEIPVTQQLRRPPPPARPPIPIPTEDEDVPDEDTIAPTELDLANVPPPPMPENVDESSDIFVVYDEPPQPIGGWKELYKHLEYPQIARRAGIEGRVIVKVLINTRGEGERVEILKPSGADVGFEEAAMYAARQMKWIPAKQRDVPVRVWMSFPVRFEFASPGE